MKLLYCFDENYNRQGFISILSFIKNNSPGLNIHIIHNNPKTFEKYSRKLSELKNTNIFIYQFENKDKVELPVGISDHISEATYYRLFLEQHLPENIDEILYIDADVVCINNIENISKDTFNKIKESDFIIAARTQGLKIHSTKLFNDLNIEHSYFNAGVMFINLENWRRLNLTKILIKKLNEIKDIIVFWDQDVMNAHFDGRYIELDENLNFDGTKHINKNELSNILSRVYLIHYIGSKKPWKISSCNRILSNIYQDMYYEAFSNFHILFDYRRKDFLNLIYFTFSGKLFNLNHPFKYLKQAVIDIFKESSE